VTNVWATSTFRYYFTVVIEWPRLELRAIDRRAQEIIAQHQGNHRCASVERLYLQRKQGESQKNYGKKWDSSFLWLKDGQVQAAPEALIIAAQDSGIVTRKYQNDVWEWDIPMEPTCRGIRRRQHGTLSAYEQSNIKQDMIMCRVHW